MLLAGSAQSLADPEVIEYQLWVDLYDLTNCDEILDSRSVWIIVSCGTKKTNPAYARLKN